MHVAHDVQQRARHTIWDGYAQRYWTSSVSDDRADDVLGGAVERGIDSADAAHAVATIVDHAAGGQGHLCHIITIVIDITLGIDRAATLGKGLVGEIAKGIIIIGIAAGFVRAGTEAIKGVSVD